MKTTQVCKCTLLCCVSQCL